MRRDKLNAPMVGIEAQLRVIAASRARRASCARSRGLRRLKGALKGEGRFDPEEIDAARVRRREDL